MTKKQPKAVKRDYGVDSKPKDDAGAAILANLEAKWLGGKPKNDYATIAAEIAADIEAARERLARKPPPKRWSSKVGIAAIICWGIVGFLAMGICIVGVDFPALFGTFGLLALLFTLIVILRKKG